MHANPFVDDATRYFRGAQPSDEERLAVALLVVVLTCLLLATWCVCCACFAGKCARRVLCLPCAALACVFRQCARCGGGGGGRGTGDTDDADAPLRRCLYETLSDTDVHFRCAKLRARDRTTGRYSPFCSTHRNLFASQRLVTEAEAAALGFGLTCRRAADTSNDTYTQNYGYLTPKQRAKYERDPEREVRRVVKKLTERQAWDAAVGYVYMFRSAADAAPDSPSCPRWLKIGFTTRTPEERVKEWPGAVLVNSWRVHSGGKARLAERLVHTMLALKRYRRFNVARQSLEVEWFYTTEQCAAATIERVVEAVNKRDTASLLVPAAPAAATLLPALPNVPSTPPTPKIETSLHSYAP